METLSLSADTLFLQFATAYALCAIACGLIMAGRMSIRRAADSEKWPVVQGVVLETSVAAVREEGRQRFRPSVRYNYEVDGKRYEGSRLQWASEGFRKFTRARRLLDRYRTGNTVKVHYDPSRPATAVLLTGHAGVLRPMHIVASTAAIYTVFTIGMAIAAGH
jgi:hypothetical protein